MTLDQIREVAELGRELKRRSIRLNVDERDLGVDEWIEVVRRKLKTAKRNK